MGWLASVGVGLCTGVVGFLIALFAAVWAVELLRIPSREACRGLLCLWNGASRFLHRHCPAAFLREAPSAGRITSVLARSVRGARCSPAWPLSFSRLRGLRRIRCPRLADNAVELVIELRRPPGFVMPQLADPTDAYATIIKLPTGDTTRWSPLELDSGPHGRRTSDPSHSASARNERASQAVERSARQGTRGVVRLRIRRKACRERHAMESLDRGGVSGRFSAACGRRDVFTCATACRSRAAAGEGAHARGGGGSAAGQHSRGVRRADAGCAFGGLAGLSRTIAIPRTSRRRLVLRSGSVRDSMKR